MKSALMKVSQAVLFLFVMFTASAITPAVAAGNHHHDRCERHCNEEFQRRKDECRRFRGHERHRCEEDAKADHRVCKDRVANPVQGPSM